ncbi:hypothetical protein [Microcystis aeruginosa]|nr:hypothetical protein [Microcystis aeruginosa]MDB9415659.1 hypothetical protein [Microcystis aeruginosa CS-556/03]
MRGECLAIYFGQSAETSDFVVDYLELWWQENQALRFMLCNERGL